MVLCDGIVCCCFCIFFIACSSLSIDIFRDIKRYPVTIGGFHGFPTFIYAPNPLYMDREMELGIRKVSRLVLS